MNFTYQDGVKHLVNIGGQALSQNQPVHSIEISINERLSIKYPGWKKDRFGNSVVGDYAAYWDDETPEHAEVVEHISKNTDSTNVQIVHDFLNHIFVHGTSIDFTTLANVDWLNKEFQQLVYWITMQEDINYPRPRKKGVTLPLSRFYEASLIHAGFLYDLETVINRTEATYPVPRNDKKDSILNAGYVLPAFYY